MAELRIDWKEYYREFQSIHGGPPVIYRVDEETGKGGWLLFRDGWRYGRSPEGPEYPPENIDRQLEMIRAYWKIRLGVLKEEQVRLEGNIRELVQLQRGRSASLYMPFSYMEEDDTGKKVRRSGSKEIDFKELLNDLRMTAEEIWYGESSLENCAIPEIASNDFSPAAILAELDEIKQALVRKPAAGL